MAYKISGDVKVGSTPLARTVRAYSRATGALVGSTTSDGSTGVFELFVPTGGEHFVLALDSTENAQILDRITPITVASSGILDTYQADVSVAFSLRRLFTAYSGPLLRVRNASNAEVDIGFDSNGLLDSASLLTHVGSGDGFVTTWYDQSGQGHNLTRATAGEQPRIATAGAVNAYVQFDGSNDTMTTGSVSSAVAKSVYYNGIPFSVNPFIGTLVAWQITGTVPIILSFNVGSSATQPINLGGAMLYFDSPMSDAARAFVVNASLGPYFADQVLLRVAGSTYVTSSSNTAATGSPIGGGVVTLGGIPGQSNYAASHFGSFVVFDAAHSAATADAINAILDF